MPSKLVILGEYNPAWETHRMTNAAIEHSLAAMGETLDVTWCSTEDVSDQIVHRAAGLWIATGAPYASMLNALEAIRQARERQIPSLGTCQGFQHLMLEYAQAFLGLANPAHEEYGSNSEKPFIAALACSLKGKEATIQLAEGSLAHASYGEASTTEKFYCSFGVHPEFTSRRSEGPLHISGVDEAGEMRIVEYPDHPFMVGTLFVPQARSQSGNPHPLINAFVRAMVRS